MFHLGSALGSLNISDMNEIARYGQAKCWFHDNSLRLPSNYSNGLVKIHSRIGDGFYYFPAIK